MTIREKDTGRTALALSLGIALLAAGCMKSVSAASAKEGSMEFVVFRTSGTVKMTPRTWLLGETRADSPSEAVWRFVSREHRQWKEHADSRTATYVRVENPVTFVSSKIDFYAARAGRFVRDDAGKLRFTVRLTEGSGAQAKVLEEKVVWAANAPQALAACLGRAVEDDEVDLAEGLYGANLQKPGTQLVCAAAVEVRWLE